MFLRSERLFLRPGWPEDGDDLARLNAMDLPAGELPPRPLAVELLDALVPLPEMRLYPQLCITRLRAGVVEIVGGIGIQPGGPCPALSVWIAPPFRGQGYATEAVRAILGLAAALGHRRIAARCNPREPAIRKVLTRSGFMGLGPGHFAFEAAAAVVGPERLAGVPRHEPCEASARLAVPVHGGAPAPGVLHRFTPPARRQPQRGTAP